MRQGNKLETKLDFKDSHLQHRRPLRAFPIPPLDKNCAPLPQGALARTRVSGSVRAFPRPGGFAIILGPELARMSIRDTQSYESMRAGISPLPALGKMVTNSLCKNDGPPRT
jgi:hypothetical protein